MLLTNRGLAEVEQLLVIKQEEGNMSVETVREEESQECRIASMNS